MKRREFLKQAALTAATVASATADCTHPANAVQSIAKRTLGKTGEKLSMIGFGGIRGDERRTRCGSEHRGRGRRSRHQLLRHRAQLRQRAGAARPGPGALSQKCFLACKTEGRTKDDSRTATRGVAAPAQDRSRGPVPVPRADQDEGTGQGARSRRRDGDHGSREEGRQDPLHRLLGSFAGDRAGGARPLQLRHDSVPGELGAVHPGRLRSKDSKKGAGKADGHPGAEEHGQDGVACRPEKRIIPSPSAGISRPRFPTKHRWACAGRWAIPSPPPFRRATRSTSAWPWTWRRTTSRWSRTKSRRCWAAGMAWSRSSIWATMCRAWR